MEIRSSKVHLSYMVNRETLKQHPQSINILKDVLLVIGPSNSFQQKTLKKVTNIEVIISFNMAFLISSKSKPFFLKKHSTSATTKKWQENQILK